MRHQVYLPYPLPVGIARLFAALDAYSGVRAEKVYLPVSLDGLIHEARHVCLAAHICGHGQARYFIGHARCSLSIDVCDDDRSRALGAKAAAERAAYSARSARNHSDSIAKLHIILS
jgi:hypothetical protein